MVCKVAEGRAATNTNQTSTLDWNAASTRSKALELVVEHTLHE